ncbi:MAG: D-alanyl-D-alanine carboxypeptidase [Ruminococcus sp.]|nr:D-alanyl-D-alanine carboxypeptidase [Ruminococcus sp.]
MNFMKKVTGENRWIGILLIVSAAILVFLLIAVIIVSSGKSDWKESSQAQSSSSSEDDMIFVTNTGVAGNKDKPARTDENVSKNYPDYADDALMLTASNIYSDYAVLLDVQTNDILAYRGAELRMSPASMTKLMTLLVAVENISDFNAKYTLTYEMISPLIEQDAARAGFEDQETVSITDLLYGMILPSGADATIAVVQYVAGNEDTFVDMMNDKAAELGMTHTHFTNSTGLFDEQHYSTAVDIAMLMKEVMQNTICRKILSTVEYTTTSTQQHPGGILLQSTTFSRMYGTEVSGIEIIAGKTGFHDQAMQCLASYARAVDGKEYVLITAHAATDMDPIRDAFAIYGTITGTYAMPTDLESRTTTTASDVYVIVTDEYGALVTDENGEIATQLAVSSETTETETVDPYSEEIE